MWKMVFGSAQGTSHVRTEQPCQDYTTAAFLGVNEPLLLAACCCDGAGSASHSHIGAQAAGDRFLAAVAKWAAVATAPPSTDELRAWACSARNRVLDEAKARDLPPRELASTLLGAVIGDSWAAFVQIGDGAMIFDGDAGYLFAFWPDTGEYANTTRFLTDEEADRFIRAEVVVREISDFAVFSDGLQMLALDYRMAGVHGPFFDSLFHAIRNCPESADLRPALLDFLNSKRVNDRTDDDKSLLLATRRPPDGPAILSNPTD